MLSFSIVVVVGSGKGIESFLLMRTVKRPFVSPTNCRTSLTHVLLDPVGPLDKLVVVTDVNMEFVGLDGFLAVVLIFDG